MGEMNYRNVAKKSHPPRAREEEEDQAVPAAAETSCCASPGAHSSKKRRRLDANEVGAPARDDDEAATTKNSSGAQQLPARQQQQPSYYEDEIARLRNQNQQLKKIACQALSGFKDPNSQAKFYFDDEVAEEWQKDGALAAAAVRGGHLDWWNLADSIMYDSRVAAAVFMEAKRVRADVADLSADNRGDVMLAALLTEEKIGISDFRIHWCYDVPLEWQRTHKRLALFGVAHRCVHAEYCPCLFDRVFLKDQIERNKSSFEWEWLPSQLRYDIDFARSIQVFNWSGLPNQILRNIPALRGDRDFWRKVMKSAVAADADREADYWGSVRSVIGDYASMPILSDRDIMLDACSVNARVMRLVDASLARDHDFLVACVERNPFCLLKISRDIQRMFPDVIDKALLSFKEEEHVGLGTMYRLADKLDRMFWEDRAFVLRWFECGFAYLHNADLREPLFRKTWKGDEEFFLLNAKHCRADLLHESFENIGSSLRNNRKFMLRVLKIQPTLMIFAGLELKHDFELCSIVLSDRKGAEAAFFEYLRWDAVDFLSEANRQLALHGSFCSLVLPAISLLNDDSECALSILNQGTSTTLAYKKLIAEYMGVPTGERLRRIRQAFRNLNALLHWHGPLARLLDDDEI